MNDEVKFVVKWAGAALGGLTAVILLMYFVVLPLLEEVEIPVNEPCGSKSPQALCYSTPQALCLSVWASFEKGCDESVKAEIRKEKPSSLVGPAIRICTMKKFDKVMLYNRTNQEDPFCSDYYKKLQD